MSEKRTEELSCLLCQNTKANVRKMISDDKGNVLCDECIFACMQTLVYEQPTPYRGPEPSPETCKRIVIHPTDSNPVSRVLAEADMVIEIDSVRGRALITKDREGPTKIIDLSHETLIVDGSVRVSGHKHSNNRFHTSRPAHKPSP